MKKQGLTPMMQQYLQIKEEYSDCILFFRLGDFYEMFFDDARIASEILEITLTGKDCGMEERAPMCGVPYHSAQGYIAKLIKHGKKVAICEQVEDPKEAKGIVKRDVLRVVTPGTANIDLPTPESDNNFLASVYYHDHYYAVTFADISTGEVYVLDGKYECTENALAYAISIFKPSELILNQSGKSICKDIIEIKKRCDFFDSIIEDRYYDYDASVEAIKNQFKGKTLDNLGITDKEHIIRSVGALFMYLSETQKRDLSHLNELKICETSSFLNLDISSRRNLEITETMREKAKRGSLLGVLDKTKTAMGARRLKSWLDRPLVEEKKIAMRLDAVEELFNSHDAREDLTHSLKKIYDIERIISRVVYGSCNARDFLSLKQSIDKFPKIKSAIGNMESVLLKEIYNGIDNMNELYLLIECAIDEEAPVTVKEGGMIKQGFDKELDRIKDILSNSTLYMAKIEAEEREKTGIKNLKIKYNKVFGYYIEVSNSNVDKVPDYYIRKQTLVNGERYITKELKDLENSVLSAREKINTLEYENFLAVKGEILKKLEALQKNAKLISVADCLCSLANVAKANSYVKPLVNSGNVINIKDGRHPIVETYMKDSIFVPNDTYLNTDDSRFSIITGPNMAGKSTYMRQTAIIVLMAQIGSFVPASFCEVGIVDAIFTRVGASDDLASGQSTFMVEMNEVSHILKNATSKSLVILDEIGRGTSTYDGLSIAWSVAEYISNKEKIGAKTLFATHYHELTDLEKTKDGIKNYSVAVKKRGDDITFLRKIVRGGTDDSFGIEVAKLAGVPDEVISRAKEILVGLDNGEKKEKISVPPRTESYQNNASNEITEYIKNLDVTTLTPIEALNELYKLNQLLK